MWVILTYINRLPNPPLVTSLSWGWMEADTCDSITNARKELFINYLCTPLECQLFGNDPQVYVNRTNIELLKAGTMGLSVLVCTQDEGAPSGLFNTSIPSHHDRQQHGLLYGRYKYPRVAYFPRLQPLGHRRGLHHCLQRQCR